MRQKQDVIVDEGVVYLLKSGVKVYLKTADVCAMFGKSNQWIGQLTSQGAIHKSNTPHGTMYELTPTVKGYCDLLESRVDEPEDEESIRNEKERQKAETGIKRAKAIVAMLEAQELQGKMHRSDDVANMTADLIDMIRGMLLALPGRLAVDTAAAGSAAESSLLIRREAHRIMQEIANYEYDPRKYEEHVRERRRWSERDEGDSDD